MAFLPVTKEEMLEAIAECHKAGKVLDKIEFDYINNSALLPNT